MLWQICFGCSLSILAVSLLFIFVKDKWSGSVFRTWKALNILMAGVFMAIVLLLVPIYCVIFEGEVHANKLVALMTLHNAVQLFLMNGDFGLILDNTAQLGGALRNGYYIYAAILYVIAPVLTFGVVLSFFKNISAYQRYLWKFHSEAYIFSELNEKSLALAKSIRENNKKRVIVFTGVCEDDTEQELVNQAEAIRALCFKKDMLSVKFQVHSKKQGLYFFAVSQSEAENVKQALEVISAYQERSNTYVYVFAVEAESEVLLSGLQKGKVKVRRINEVQSLISRELYDKGQLLFEHAVLNESGLKTISAVIVGMGRYGTEMAKTLPWFCQMDGYDVRIHCFEKDSLAEEKFAALCPELMDAGHNGADIEGEAKYKITIYPGVDAETKAFADKVMKIPNVNYVFVALGNDELNIKVALTLRMLFERIGIKPRIQAVVFHTDKKEALCEITNFKGQKYEIDFIGDIQTGYSEEVILKSDLEQIALERHLKWGSEEDFWAYDYNYKSSIASAIHKKMKALCGIPGIEKPVEHRTEEELWAIRKLEHRRWNAYMRSEGYCYAAKRNDLAKTHHCLVPFDELSEKEKKKDDD